MFLPPYCSFLLRYSEWIDVLHLDIHMYASVMHAFYIYMYMFNNYEFDKGIIFYHILLN